MDVKYPNRPTETYKIIWEGDWVERIEGLPDSEFVCFDEHDESFYNDAIQSERFEIVILLNNKKQILKIRTLSPCVYTEEFHEIALTSKMIAKIDRKAKSILSESKKYLRDYAEELDRLATKFAVDMIVEVTKERKK